MKAIMDIWGYKIVRIMYEIVCIIYECTCTGSVTCLELHPLGNLFVISLIDAE